MLNLGNAYATVGLDHTEFDRGVEHVGSGVDTIIGHLGRIGDVVIGVTLAQSLEGLLQKLGELPRKLVSINAEMETIGLGMAAHLENASKLVASTIEGAGAELAEATHKESLRLERIVQNMRDAQDDLQRRRDEVGTRRNVLSGDTESQLTRATSSHEERLNEINRSQRNAAEDFVERNGNAFATMTHQLRDYNERWAEGTQERARTFNQSINDLAANHGRALSKLSSEMGDAAGQFRDKIADAASNSATRLADLSEKHSEAVQNTERDIVRSEQNYSQDLLVRQTKLGDQISDIGSKYADATRRVTEEGAKAAEDFAIRVQDIQANASRSLEGLRIGEAQATLRFQFNQRQLQRQLSRASTPDQRSELQDRLQYTQAEEALRQQAAQKQISDVDARRRKETEAAERTLREVGIKGEERVKQEAEQRDRQVQNAVTAYSREISIAQRAHTQQLADLRQRLDAETGQYERQTESVGREHAQQVRNAERAYAQRVESLTRSISDEDQQYAQQTSKLQADFAARNELAAEQRSRQIRDAEEQYEREARSAKLAYERVSEGNADRAERETRSYTQHLDDIDRRSQDTRNRIESDSAHSEVIYERRIRDLEVQYQEAERSFQARYAEASGEILARNSQVANLFSKSWVEATNAMLKSQDLATGGPPGGRHNYFSETTDIMERQRQVMAVLREESFKLPGTFQEIAKSAQQMMGFGLDPFEKGLYRIVAGLSLMPGAANVGTEGIIRAFGQLRAGATGQAERIFREIGVPLRQIPGLVFDAAGKLQTDLPKAWRIVLDYFGPKTDVILKQYESSWVVLTSNLQELFENLMRIAGEPLFKNTKAFLQTLYVDIVQHGPEIQAAAARIGEGLGNFVNGIYNFVIKLTDPKTIGYIQTLGAIIGRTGDNIKEFARGVTAALGGVKEDAGLGDFITSTLRLVERISSVFADPQTIRSFGVFLQTLGETKDEALRLIGEFIAGLAGTSRADAEGGLQEFVQNLTVIVLRIKRALEGISSEDAQKAAATLVEFARTVTGAIGEAVSFAREHGDELKGLALIFVGFKVSESVIGGIRAAGTALSIFGAVIGRVWFVVSTVSLAMPNVIAGFQLFGQALATLGTRAATALRFLAPLVGNFGALRAALSGLMPVLSAGVIPALQLLSGELATLAGVTTTAVVAALGGPVTAAIIALGVVVAGLALAWVNNWGDIQGKTAAVASFFTETVVPGIVAFKDKVVGEITELSDSIGTIAGTLKGIWDAVFGPWATALENLSGQIKGWFDANGEEAGKWVSHFVEGLYNGFAAAIGLYFPETWVSQLLGAAIYDKLKGFWEGLGTDQQKWVTDALMNIPITIIKWVTGVALIESLANVTKVMTEWVKTLDGKFTAALRDVIFGAFSLAFGGLAPLVNEALHKVYGSGILGEWLDRLSVQGPNRLGDIAERMGSSFGRIADGIDGVVDRSNASLSGLGSGLNQQAGANVGGAGFGTAGFAAATRQAQDDRQRSQAANSQDARENLAALAGSTAGRGLPATGAERAEAIYASNDYVGMNALRTPESYGRPGSGIAKGPNGSIGPDALAFAYGHQPSRTQLGLGASTTSFIFNPQTGGYEQRDSRFPNGVAPTGLPPPLAASRFGPPVDSYYNQYGSTRHSPIGNAGDIITNDQGIRYATSYYGDQLTASPLDFTGPGGSFGAYQMGPGGNDWYVAQNGGRSFDVKGGVSPWANGYDSGGGGGSALSLGLLGRVPYDESLYQPQAGAGALSGGNLDNFYNMIGRQGPQTYGNTQLGGTISGSQGDSTYGMPAGGDAYQIDPSMQATLDLVRAGQDQASAIASFGRNLAEATGGGAAGGGGRSGLDMLNQAAGRGTSGATNTERLRSSASGVVPGAPGQLESTSKAPGGTPGYNTESGRQGGVVQNNNFEQVIVEDANPNYMRRFLRAERSALSNL